MKSAVHVPLRALSLVFVMGCSDRPLEIPGQEDRRDAAIPDASGADAASSDGGIDAATDAGGKVLSLLAGALGGRGTVDGSGPTARFNMPYGAVVNALGDIYIADTYNHTIRKVTPDGFVSTLAGQAGFSGSSDGTGTAARFNTPHGVALDSAGNIYVADTFNHTIRKVTPEGVVSTLAGLAGQFGPVNPSSTNTGDGSGAAARFKFPSGVALDSADHVYVADWGNETIRKITPEGIVSTLAGQAGQSGANDGTGATARFSIPHGVSLDNLGSVYVADYGNHTIRKVTSGGVVTTFAGQAGQFGSNDTGDGQGPARFNKPTGVAVDRMGNVFVATPWTIRKVTPAGVVSTLAGSKTAEPGSSDGSGADARFNNLNAFIGGPGGVIVHDPNGVAVDSAGYIYFADTNNHTIRKITPNGVVSTLAGLADQPGPVHSSLQNTGDGSGSAARFNTPFGAALDNTGNVYIADTYNHTIRKVTPDGIVSTLAGQAGVSGSNDGTGAAARFSIPYGVALDSNGNIYVADTVNWTLRKITPDGVVSTLAGLAGQYGSADGSGAAARFYDPSGVALDSANNLYVADSTTLRKVTPDGVVSTLAGLAGQYGSADGSGSAARFYNLFGVALDRAGNVYGTDNQTIRKVTPDGVVSTLAGKAGQAGPSDPLSDTGDGSGQAARFFNAFGVAVDDAGDIYVADTYNHRIRKVTQSGVVTTFAGVPQVTHLQPGPLPTQLSFPRAVAARGSKIIVLDEQAVLEIQ